MNKGAPTSWKEHLERNRNLEHEIVARATESLPPRAASGFRPEPTKVVFNDEFAPSESEVYVSDPAALEGPARGLFYGGDWHDIGQAAVDRSADFGLPSLMWPNLGQFTSVDDAQLASVLPKWGAVVSAADEGSEDWICLQIYFHLLQASNLLTVGEYGHLLFDAYFRLGALVRELDLTSRNKKAANSRRRSTRALQNDVAARESAMTRAGDASEWREHARAILGNMTGDLSKSAKAQHILANWDSAVGEGIAPARPAKKTIQNWLSKETVPRAYGREK